MNFYKSLLFQKSLELLNINAHVGRGVWTLDWIYIFFSESDYAMLCKSENLKEKRNWKLDTCCPNLQESQLKMRTKLQAAWPILYLGMRQVVIATVNFEVDILIKGSRHFFKHSAENILRQDIWNWHVVFSLSIL